MNNNKKNQYLEMFLDIADELLQEQKIKSRRDFSSRYLNKCSNYIGSLVYQDKKPSKRKQEAEKQEHLQSVLDELKGI